MKIPLKSFISCLITFPPSFILQFLFRKSAPRKLRNSRIDKANAIERENDEETSKSITDNTLANQDDLKEALQNESASESSTDDSDTDDSSSSSESSSDSESSSSACPSLYGSSGNVPSLLGLSVNKWPFKIKGFLYLNACGKYSCQLYI